MSQESVHPDAGAPQTPLEEELVAYLDGELDDASARRVEQMLAADPKVRGELQGLERTWHLLDRLDRVTPEEDFTRTTLEMVAVAAKEDLEEQQVVVPRRRRRRWLLGGVGLLASAAVGFLALILLRPSPNRRLLEDLPVLENLDQYRHVDSIEFLRLLDGEGLFQKDAAPAGKREGRPSKEAKREK